MPENKGFYQKYRVERTDGKLIRGRTLTLEIDTDPLALPALRAYRQAVVADGRYPEWSAALDQLLAEIDDPTGRPNVEG